MPLNRQIGLVRFVDSLRANYRLNIGVFGHCGDGNLHVNFMYDEDNEEETGRAVEALHQLMEKVVTLDGAISGEHGVGLAKTFVPNQFNQAEWNTMLAVKKTLDPKGILNPGKFLMSLNHGITKKRKLSSLGSVPIINLYYLKTYEITHFLPLCYLLR